MKEFVVAVDVPGVGRYEIEFISADAERAKRRAVVHIAAGFHRDLDMNKFEATILEERELASE